MTPCGNIGRLGWTYHHADGFIEMGLEPVKIVIVPSLHGKETTLYIKNHECKSFPPSSIFVLQTDTKFKPAWILVDMFDDMFDIIEKHDVGPRAPF